MRSLLSPVPDRPEEVFFVKESAKRNTRERLEAWLGWRTRHKVESQIRDTLQTLAVLECVCVVYSEQDLAINLNASMAGLGWGGGRLQTGCKVVRSKDTVILAAECAHPEYCTKHDGMQSINWKCLI